MTHLESIASSAVRSLFLLRPQFLFTVNMGNIFSHLLMMYHKVFIKHGFLSMKTIFQVRAAIKVKASVIICFTSSGRAARQKEMNIPLIVLWFDRNESHIICVCRLISMYRPSMPVLSVVIPHLKTNQLRWSFTGAFEVREQPFPFVFLSNLVHVSICGIWGYPILACR